MCVAAQGEEHPVFVERQLDMADLPSAMGIRQKALAAVVDPLHRAAEDARGVQDRGRFRIDPVFDAKTAAHIRGHMVQVVGRDVQNRVGEDIAVGMDVLRGVVEHETVALGIVFGKGTARLDGHRRNTIVDHIQCHYMRRRRQSRVSRLRVAQLEIDRHIARRIWPNLRCAFADRMADTNDGVELRIGDFNQLGSCAGLLFGFGNDQSHVLADIAHTVHRQTMAWRHNELAAVPALAHPPSGKAWGCNPRLANRPLSPPTARPDGPWPLRYRYP